MESRHQESDATIFHGGVWAQKSGIVMLQDSRELILQSVTSIELCLSLHGEVTR